MLNNNLNISLNFVNEIDNVENYFPKLDELKISNLSKIELNFPF